MAKRRRTDKFQDVDELLATLRDARCSTAKVTLTDGKVTGLEVVFAPEPAPATPFVDKKGRPVDLDEGMPELARDPDDENDEETPIDDEPSDRAIERANFRKRHDAAGKAS